MRHHREMPRSIGVLLVACIACAAPPSPSAFAECTPEAPLSVGEQLPDCEFAGVGDRPSIALIDLRGKPTVINFWAEWCTACRAEMPDFDEVHLDLGREIRVVGLDTLGVMGETEAAAERFADEIGVGYPLAFDVNGGFYSHFGNTVRPLMPTTVFADADGIVRGIWLGQLTEEKLRELIADHLGVS